ncbi:MAG TPA: 4-alpha-glucanotransferase [Gammaproteobacteria bacterium]
MTDVLGRRRAGVLLHPTSLPGSGPNGTLGNDALRFVDWLVGGGFTVWQTLPLGPADAYGSPYRLQSTYAGDPRLIDPRRLAELDELPKRMAHDAVHGAPLDAYRSFCACASPEQQRRFARFMRRDRKRLLPYGLFELCKHRFGGAPWWEWPPAFRRRPSAELLRLLAAERERFRATAFRQYLFELSWSAVKRYANARGVYLFGDLPFYVDHNSVEVWWEPHLFQLDADGRPFAIAGVPPDYFNENGQLWGNPLYDWRAHERSGFDWWMRRLERALERFDLLRIDHFRALESYWEVPASAASAREGRWREAPGAALLETVRARFGSMPLVAEDLGLITDEVRALRDRFELPGMVVLQFAFDGLPDNPHVPEHHRRNEVVYTGTHDNDTVVGWYASLDDATRARVDAALGSSPPDLPAALIEKAYASPAQLAIVPMQDLMGLGSEARMNRPGTAEGNWGWRFDWRDLDPRITVEARRRAERYERAVPPSEGGAAPTSSA